MLDILRNVMFYIYAFINFLLSLNYCRFCGYCIIARVMLKIRSGKVKRTVTTLESALIKSPLKILDLKISI